MGLVEFLFVNRYEVYRSRPCLFHAAVERESGRNISLREDPMGRRLICDPRAKFLSNLELHANVALKWYREKGTQPVVCFTAMKNVLLPV